ncbi:helix-turn-helix domain-containing protein [Arthrobacter sp.]|uniref:helix-turn-helix domain-containing protein n=1 Tax=Arthrobacter sp. TaxID=1667 RepID=UPI0033951233
MQTGRKTLGPATDQGNAVQLMTTEEVAVWLQVAPKTLRNSRSAGIGPTALKLYSVVRYDRAAVEAWKPTRTAPKPS